jgi:hypothetical protein
MLGLFVFIVLSILTPNQIAQAFGRAESMRSLARLLSTLTNMRQMQFVLQDLF